MVIFSLRLFTSPARCPPSVLVSSPHEDTRRLSGRLSGKEPACNAGELGSILCQQEPLEEGMATRSSILAWRSPWMEEPGGLWATGSQRVRQH